MTDPSPAAPPPDPVDLPGYVWTVIFQDSGTLVEAMRIRGGCVWQVTVFAAGFSGRRTLSFFVPLSEMTPDALPPPA